MKKKLIYFVLVFLLLAIPFLLPTGMAIPGINIACCLFVATCFYLNINSQLAVFFPVVFLCIIAPISVFILMGGPIYKSYTISVTQLYRVTPVTDWAKMIVPIILSVGIQILLSRIYRHALPATNDNGK
ncbi:MAG: hypothetical protein PHP95_15770 [Desulfuromonadaceae bacterium]|nr:hypothetical protein [Desulfuromonadaceae bacterium]MDD2849910.1 hypothetical protein [Desulfuromonadaceae bacterium]MDD4131732.1 hypothetical protein [Desulfuromonadaceae bacterium]